MNIQKTITFLLQLKENAETLQKENDELKEKIEKLEKEIKELKATK